MAEIFPFRAYRYNPSLVDPARVLTQPYDKITPAMAEKYAAASPYNLVPVEKGTPRPTDTASDSVYTRAAQALEDWIRDKVIVRDAAPSLYVYFQEFDLPETGEPRLRKGFITLGRIEDYSAGVVFRHEQTLSGPKADRLELLRHTQTHTGQLFMLYSDPNGRIDDLLGASTLAKPAVEVRDEFNVLHKLWPVTEAYVIEAVQREMADKKLVIADGHHRYETALAYRDERRARAGRMDLSAPYEKVMMTLFNTAGEGLAILPTHRVVSNVPNFSFERMRAALATTFHIRSYPFQDGPGRVRAYQQFREELAKGRVQRAIGAYAGVPREERSGQALGEQGSGQASGFHMFVLRREVNLDAALPGVSPMQRQLDVVLLHRLILERGLDITPDAVKGEKNIRYEREMDAAIADVDQRRAQICFLLNPVGVETVAEMAMAGEVLPQKSTDFYPKLLSGITMYRLEDPS